MKNNFTGLLKQLSDDEDNVVIHLHGDIPVLGGVIHYKPGADYIRLLNTETNHMAYIPLDKIAIIVPTNA